MNRLRNSRYAYLIAYTAVFLGAVALTFGYFVLYHKTFIWEQDGLKQHYNALLYYSRYLKQIAGGLIHEGRLSIPMWDFSIGYGSDILTTFHYYCIGDPVNLLSVLVPEAYMEYFYCLLAIMRMYFGGLFFSVFSLEHGSSRLAALSGALIYAFSAYSLVLGMMHGIFLIPVMYFPLILLGADRVFERRSPALFIISTAVSAMANFYFFYMQVALVVLYAVYRYLKMYRGVKIRELIYWLSRFIFYGIDALMISAAVFLPVMLVLASSERYKSETAVRLLYPVQYYFRFLADFAVSKRPGSWTLMGYTSVGLAAMALLFARKWKKDTGCKVVFIVLTLIALVPVGGLAMNGFSYVVNRWMWGYAFAVAFITSRVLTELPEWEEAEKRRAAAILGVIAVLSALLGESRSEESLLSMLIALIIALILALSDIRKAGRTRVGAAALALVLMGLHLNAFYRYSVLNTDWLDEFLNFHEADRNLKVTNSDELMASLGDSSFYRVEETGLGTTQNSCIQRGSRGTQFYFSLTNPYISRFINYFYCDWTKDYDYEGVESRSILESLASVKYFLAREDTRFDVPFNFDILAAQGDTPQGRVEVWENKDALPLGYTYERYVPEEVFEKLDVAGRARSMLEGAVVKECSLREAELAEVLSGGYSRDILREVTVKGNAEADGNRIKVGRNGAAVLHIDAQKGSETYVVFEGLSFEGMRERDTYNEGEWASMTPYQHSGVQVKDRFFSSPVVSSIALKTGGRTKYIEFYLPSGDYYCGRKDFLVNLGHDLDGETEVELSFRERGEYTFDSLRAVSASAQGVSEGLTRLGRERLEDVEILSNEVRGSIEVSGDRLLLLTIPFSGGWKAFVDGQEQKLLNANIMYMGLELSKGKHDIILKYTTQGLREGLFISLAGVALLMVILLYPLVMKHTAAKRGS